MSIVDGDDIKIAQEINMPDGVVAMNIFYFKADFQDPRSDAAIIAVVEDWIEALYTTVEDAVSDLVTLGEFTMYVHNLPLLQWDNHGTGTPSVTFLDVTDMLPHGVAALVRHYTTEPRTIGRKYIPGFGEGQQADGTWSGGTLTSLAAFAVAWGEVIDQDEFHHLIPGVWTTKLKIVFEMSEASVVLADPAYQRRRRPGVGT